MSRPFITLNNNKHRHLSVIERPNFSHASEQHLIPITVDEVMEASTEFPVVMVKNAEVGGFALVAMMALESATNLYCSAAQFSGLYAPRVLRIYPFSLQSSSQSGQMEVCVQDDSAILSTQRGQRLFSDDGAQSEFLKNKIQSLQHHSEQQVITHAFIQLLLKHELLDAQKVEISQANSNAIAFDGIYTVSSQKLDSLDDNTYLSLRKNGALQIIHAMQNSIKQLNRLVRLTQPGEAP